MDEDLEFQLFLGRLLEVGCVTASLYYDKNDNSFDFFIFDEDEFHVENIENLENDLKQLLLKITPEASDGIHVRFDTSRNKIYYNYELNTTNTEITKTYK